MGFKNFRLNLIVRIILLTANIFLFAFLLLSTSFTLSVILAGLLVVIQTIALIHYTDKTNRTLNNFLESIRYSDFTRTFELEGLGSSFDKLKASFNGVIKEFQNVRAEKDENYFYLQSVIQHIGIGLIAYDKSGRVELVNNATQKLFQIRNIAHVDALSGFSPDLVQKLLTIRHNENVLLKITGRDEMMQLAIYATELKISSKTITLVSIKNIQNELEEKEMESWQKLISVLTHEIMNSIAPISSLSTTISSILSSLKESSQGSDDDDRREAYGDIDMALKTISKRTEGLMHFVSTYRSLTRIPNPNLSIFPVSGLFSNIQLLLSDELKQSNVPCTIEIMPETLELQADERLIEQVLINLMKNALYSVVQTQSPSISMKAFVNKRGRPVIEVTDNGPGILPDVIDKVFIPFFTTKTTGSGIGLSLSKQIMRKHGGNITASSVPDVETKFTLTF
jgi:nitrogen fixation/metabolism regulation signal transduction histidine kinase